MKEREARKAIEKLRSHRLERIPINDRQAAVLIPLVWKEDAWNVLFEIRAGSIVQGGEICFPGGALEKGESPEQAALRETAEELLVEPSSVELICPMHGTLGPGGQEVTSFLGILQRYKGSFEKDEVERTFLLPLAWFREHEPQVYMAQLVTSVPEDFPFQEICHGQEYPFRRIPKKFYFWRTPYGTLWGMTAQLMHAALPLLPEYDHMK